MANDSCKNKNRENVEYECCGTDPNNNNASATPGTVAPTQPTEQGAVDAALAGMAEAEAQSSSSTNQLQHQQEQQQQPIEEDQQQQQEEEKERFVMAIAQADTRLVRSWKLSLLAILVISMLGVSVAVFFYTFNTEQTDFQVHFHDDAVKVLQALGSSLDLTLGAVDALAVSLVVSAYPLDMFLR
jgi:hypothetical protein